MDTIEQTRKVIPTVAGQPTQSQRPQNGPPVGGVEVLGHNLRVSTLDATFYGMMVGFGENYVAAFAIAVGLGQVTAGLVASLPILCGGIAQLFAFRVLQNNGSYRNWILFCVAIQTLSFIPLIIAAWVGAIPAWLFFLTTSLYWASGMASSPGWNAWISQLVPSGIRARYFAKRTRFTQAATLSSFLLGGLILYLGGNSTSNATPYIAIFSLALLARIVSAIFLVRHRTTVKIDTASLDAVSWREAWQSLPIDTRRLILFLIGLTAAIQTSGPFFSPYMLAQLHFDYTSFVVIVSAAFVTRILSLNWLGAFAKRYGTRNLLWAASITLVPMAPMWIFSSSFWWILTVQCVAGCVWAGYELAVMLIFFEAVPLKRRAQILTLYNFGNSVGWFIGAALGGACIQYFGATSFGYFFVFGLSGVLRLSFVVWALSSIHGSQIRNVRLDWSNLVGGIRNTPTAPIDIRGPIITASEEEAHI